MSDQVKDLLRAIEVAMYGHETGRANSIYLRNLLHKLGIKDAISNQEGSMIGISRQLLDMNKMASDLIKHQITTGSGIWFDDTNS